MAVNAELQQQVVAWSEMLRSGALSATEFVKEQAPGIMQELILSGRIYRTAMFALSFGIVLALFASSRRFVKKAEDWEEKAIVYGLHGAAAIIPVVATCDTFLPFVQVWLAPRVYILNYFQQLLR